jgi:uncharacterized damage-inducible protein DinB
MDASTIRTLYRYSEWANERLMGATKTVPAPGVARVRETLAHITGAEWLWLQRWKGIMPTELPPWHSSAGIEELVEILRDIALERQPRLDALTAEELAQPFVAQNLKRDMTFRMSTGMMLLHVANHSTYHRGQLASRIREAGGTPLATDMTIFATEHGG